MTRRTLFWTGTILAALLTCVAARLLSASGEAAIQSDGFVRSKDAASKRDMDESTQCAVSENRRCCIIQKQICCSYILEDLFFCAGLTLNTSGECTYYDYCLQPTSEIVSWTIDLEAQKKADDAAKSKAAAVANPEILSAAKSEAKAASEAATAGVGKAAKTDICSHRSVRKEVMDLTDTEWGKFVIAVQKLHETPDGTTGRSKFESFVHDHARLELQAHRGQYFLVRTKAIRDISRSTRLGLNAWVILYASMPMDISAHFLT